MTLSEILNILLGGGFLALVIGIITLKATVRKANAEAEKARADAETVRITNTENATRILVENIVKPLKEELNATREDLQATKREMASTKGRWPVCARLSRLLPAALILTAALCCSSCRTTRSVEKAEAVTEEQREFRDSTAAMIRVVTKEAVPKSEASLRISVDSLLKLPEKASYQARSGQATAKVEKSGDTIYVSATCDSLAREVEYYQSLYEWECRRSGLYKTQYDELMEKRHDPLKLGGLCLLAGLLAGIYLVTTTNKNKKQ